MADDVLLVTAGDVVDVQLTSETVIIEGADRRHVEPGHITNRMRLFVRELDGKEQKYDFEETELAVRETQRIAIVRGRRKNWRQPVNLVLYNLSSGERDTFEQGLAAYLGRTPLFGPLWKAAGFAALVAIVFWLWSNFLERGGQGGTMSIFLALMFATLTYPVFWWLCGMWDRVSERMRYKAARARFLREMDGRVQTNAPRPETPQPTPEPA